MSGNQNDFVAEMEKFKQEFRKNFKGVGIFIVILFIIFLGKTSFYTVEPEEEAVVTRFGKYLATYPPGPHFKLPFGIDKVVKVQTTRILQEEFGFRTKKTSRSGRTTYSNTDFSSESLMLTGDLNVADVEWVVHYKISDPFKYLFQISDPRTTIRDISESIMRRVVGDRTVNEVLTTGRKEIALRARELMQEVLNKYDMGIMIQTTKLQDVNPPDLVKPSFNEVNEAKQEQEQVINQAERSYNQVIPEAKGKADKLVSEAEGYADAIVNKAKGDAARFTSVYLEYKRAPSITRKRLYIEAMEEIFSKLENVTIVDPKIKGLLPVFNKITKGE